MPEPRTAIVVLAAGEGSRFGGPKQLAPLGDTPMLTLVLRAAVEASSSMRAHGRPAVPVRCVLGARADAVRTVVPDGVEVLVNERWRDGISSSLRLAVEHADADPTLSAVSVVLGDQPLVGAAAHGRLDAAHRLGASLAVATYDGRRGHPVLLSRALWSEVRELRGDSGARALMTAHEVTEVPCDGTGRPDDVDDPRALATLVDLAGRRRPAPDQG